MATITRVYTIAYVAKLLGEDEDWLHEISIEMEPEDGCLSIVSGGEDEDIITGFTDFGIECLQDLIREYRAQGRAPTKPPA